MVVRDTSSIVQLVDAQIDRVVTRPGTPPALIDSIRYAALGPGKRVRPLLSWHACVAAGGRGPESVPVGAAVEMVHAFSLVHDDLPALDNDDLRRGRPTLHRRSGEAMAILAGDALLTLAFSSLADLSLPASRVMRILNELTAATTGMIAGQVYDSLGGLPSELTDEERVVLIHRNKTGALIRASAVMGALSGPEDSPETLDAIVRYSEAIGLMFQIVDDLLDVTQPSEAVGKRTGKDAELGKLTYPGVLGVDGSRARVDELLSRAEEAIFPLGPRSAGLLDMARTLARRDH
ncbi:MAG: polyprenyl synthetase family protein [Phycisphaeraceae bacterium]|nr:polyprenyl synthetase family protein [Phycisphaeraceae bacterium]